MSIGIVIHSQSGHTARLARAVAEKLREAGHEVSIELLRPGGNVRPRERNVQLRKLPDITDYDTVLFGAPVWAFEASPVILAYLDTLSSLRGKKVLNFVTKALPFGFTGGRRAVAQMNGAVESRGAEVAEGEVFRYGMVRCSQQRIDEAAERIAQRLP
jgi:multimeric flavodoxin WrbA